MKILTVVIPNKNEGNTIIKCLKLLESQSIDFDIIISDSSDNGDDSLIKYVRGKKNIKLIEGGLPSVARNKGFDLVRTPYVLFIDADIMLYDEKIIETCLNNIDKYELISCVYKCDDDKYNWLWKMFHIIQKLLPETFVLGGFQMWKSDKFIEYGKFDNDAKVAEDWLLSRKVNKRNYKLIKRDIYTSGRRFDNKGTSWMLILMIKSWLNRNNKNWFYKTHNYWS